MLQTITLVRDFYEQRDHKIRKDIDENFVVSNTRNIISDLWDDVMQLYAELDNPMLETAEYHELNAELDCDLKLIEELKKLLNRR